MKNLLALFIVCLVRVLYVSVITGAAGGGGLPTQATGYRAWSSLLLPTRLVSSGYSSLLHGLVLAPMDRRLSSLRHDLGGLDQLDLGQLSLLLYAALPRSRGLALS